MRAIAIEGFGGRDRLKLVDLLTPKPGPDDVRVRAAGVGPWDAKTREGFFGKRRFPHLSMRSLNLNFPFSTPEL